MRYLLTITLSLLLGTSRTYAQTDDGNQQLSSQDIIILKDYEARIQDADRPKLRLDAPEVSFDSVQTQYEDVPEPQTELAITPHKTRPLATPREKQRFFRESYVKLGFGTQFSPLVDAAYHDSDIEDMLYGIRYQHLSARSKRENQRFSNHGVSAYWDYAPKKIRWRADVGYQHRKDHFFGYDETQESFQPEEVRQRVQNIDATVGFSNALATKKDINYQFTSGIRFTTDDYDQREWIQQTELHVDKTWNDMHTLEVGGEAWLSNFVPTYTNDKEREIFGLGATYVLDNGDWVLRAGGQTLFGDVSNDERWNIYPEIYTEKPLFEEHLVFYSGWKRFLQKNTYGQFLAENPWINTQLELDNSRIEDRMAGFKGAAKGFHYDFRFSNKVITQLPLYVTDSLDAKRFDVVYDKRTTIFNVSIDAGYTFKKGLALYANQNVNLYETDSEAEAWHLPVYQGTIGVEYNWKDKVRAHLDVTGLAGAKARRIDGSITTIKPTADIGLGVDYVFSDYLSFFCTLQNLASIRYERFLNYPTFGFNGHIGATFQF